MELKTDSQPGDNKSSESSFLDELVAKSTKGLFLRTPSRRGFLGWCGKMLLAATGASVLPILPLDRERNIAKADDPNCSAWYMCGAFVDRTCSCACGGNGCPPGSTTIGSWSTCCQNDTDLLLYRVFYHDCCVELWRDSCCLASGCQCYNGNPAIYCGSSPGALCCSWIQIGGQC